RLVFSVPRADRAACRGSGGAWLAGNGLAHGVVFVSSLGSERGPASSAQSCKLSTKLQRHRNSSAVDAGKKEKTHRAAQVRALSALWPMLHVDDVSGRRGGRRVSRRDLLDGASRIQDRVREERRNHRVLLHDTAAVQRATGDQDRRRAYELCLRSL